MSTVTSFIDFMAENHLTRKDAVAALGGGVAGDMGGFAAAIYLRGIQFVQIPTTLLAAVDSSVGGKTGVDISAGKNLAGAFWQPSLVICDTDIFGTLMEDGILDGTAEILKTGAIRDAALFDKAAGGNIMDMADEIIERCVQIKGAVVDADEKESGLRRILNFGHTMGHAIEKYSDYGLSHGKAVAIGMLMVTKAFEGMGKTEQGTYERLFRVIESKGFKTEYYAPLEELCILAASDKKTSGKSISLVYIPEIGMADTYDVELDKLYEVMR
jgi:3-dehydroquinate synthase